MASAPPECILFTEDFHRADLYGALGPPVATADWRGVVGWLRARNAPAAVVVEIASARALDVVRALQGDPELGVHRLVGVALDPETVALAVRLGIPRVIPREEAERDGGSVLATLLFGTDGNVEVR